MEWTINYELIVLGITISEEDTETQVGTLFSRFN